MDIVRGTPRRPITGCGRGFFGVLERPNEEFLGWTDSGLGDGTAGHQHLAIEARAPVRRTTRMIEPAHCQQPWNDHGISEDQVRKAEEPELKYLEAQALGAELTRGQVKPLGKDTQKALDAVRGRVQQRRLATQNQYASMQQRDMLTYTDVPQSRESREFQPSLPPYRAHGSTGPQGTTGFTPTPLSRKRLNDESDDQDDAYGQGRRVRPKTHVAYPEAHVESAASANERIYGAGGAVPRRHVHPAQYIRASRTAKSVGSSQPLMAINNMVGGMPSINTQNPPQQSNYLPDGILPKTEHPPAHSAHPSIQLVHARSKVQSWADRSSFAVQKAFNSHPSGYQRNQTPPLELTEPYLPPYQSMASRNHTELAGNPARAPATLAFMPSFQPTQGTTTNVPNPKKRRRTAEDSTEDTPVDEDDNQPANKRQARRQKLESQGFELPKDTDKPMGKVLQDSAGNDYIMLDGRQEYTAYHHDQRMSLLACENAKSRYQYPLDRGEAFDDETSFHPDYASINLADRHARPDVLFQWNGPKKGQRHHPGFMRDPSDGKLLLSKDRRPILDWPQLPKVLSSKVSGLLLTYFCRLNPHIKLEDLVARCPKVTSRKGTSLSQSAYSNRMQDARIGNGTCAWDIKERSQGVRDAIESVMPQRVLDERNQSNTTRSWRDLSKEEVRAIKLINKGTRSERKKPDSQALSTEQKKTADKVQSSSVTAIIDRRLRDKRNDDAVYARTGINHGLRRPNPPAPPPPTTTTTTTNHGLQLAPLAPPRPLAPPQPLAPSQLDTTDPAKTIHIGGDGWDYNPALIRTHIPPKEPVDLRYTVPEGWEAQISITDSLYITRQAYKALTGGKFPTADMAQSYMDQWSDMYQSLTDFYARRGLRHQVPPLVQRPAWYYRWNGWKELPGASVRPPRWEPEPLPQ